uniref:HNH endonuclease n=1 Tax=Pseudomonas asplenii TaxID=53407 RepID=UPI0018DEDF62
MRRCIYCLLEKDESDFTLEHVIPKFLGGAYAPDALKTHDACDKCNNNLGLFVDASFEKNWLVHNHLKMAALAFYDPRQPIGIPLICMGNSDLAPPKTPKDHICESWLGSLG